MGKTKYKNISKDQSAISSTIDSLFFLVLVSIAAVILMPSIMVTDQDEALYYRSTQELDTYLLESLLSSKVEGFEYTYSPLAMSRINIPDNSAIEEPLKVSIVKEQNHITYSDLIAEDLML